MAAAPEHFDLIVLGTGTVGQTIAHAARRHGLGVAAVESRVPGGTCANAGCDAKKPFANAAALLHDFYAFSQQSNQGLRGDPVFDWPRVLAFKSTFTAPVGERVARDLNNDGVVLIHGRPSFEDRRTLVVGSRRFTAGRFVIATGEQPRAVETPGAALAVTPDDFVSFNRLPRRLVFVGGGYINLELACAAAAAGAHVTVLTDGPRPMESFDEDAVAVLQSALPGLGPHGVRLHCGHPVTRLAPGDGGVRVYTAPRGDTPTAVAEVVVNASGRTASIDELNLRAAGIAASPDGVAVDKHLRSISHPRVFAAGDVADTGRLARTPTEDARTLVHNLFGDRGHPPARLRSHPQRTPATAAFTVPPVAGVGLTETQARERHGDSTRIVTADYSSSNLLRQRGLRHAYYKLILRQDDHQDDRLLGAHLVGRAAKKPSTSSPWSCTRGERSTPFSKAPSPTPRWGA